MLAYGRRYDGFCPFFGTLTGFKFVRLNDHFQFAILGANTIDVSIYNRWGEQVYHNPAQTNGVSGTDGWDGTVNGKAAPDDSYVYQMKVTYFDNTVKTKSGTVTIVR